MVFVRWDHGVPHDATAPPRAGLGADGTDYASGASAAAASRGSGVLIEEPITTAFGTTLLPQIWTGQFETFNAPIDDIPGGHLLKTAIKQRKKVASPIQTQVYLRRFEESPDAHMRQMALWLAIGGFVGADSLEQAKEFATKASRRDIIKVHEDFVAEVAQLQLLADKSGKFKLTPEQYLEQQVRFRLPGWKGSLKDLSLKNIDQLAADFGGGALEGEEAEEKFTGTKKHKATVVDLMSPADARGMVRTLLQQELGRDPTQAEYEDFVSALHGAQRKNPSTITTRSNIVEGEEVSSHTTQTGGLDQSGLQQVAYERLKKQPAWEEWQAVGVYAPALMASLDAPVPGV